MFYRMVFWISIEFSLVSPNFIRFDWVWLGLTGFDWVLLGFTVFDWVFRGGQRVSHGEAVAVRHRVESRTPWRHAHLSSVSAPPFAVFLLFFFYFFVCREFGTDHAPNRTRLCIDLCTGFFIRGCIGCSLIYDKRLWLVRPFCFFLRFFKTSLRTDESRTARLHTVPGVYVPQRS